jgi:hypothetical protein
MEALRTAGVFAAALLLTNSTATPQDFDWDDIFAPYEQRLDTATTSSGNAQNVNAATQMITPWPPYVRNRRIPGDGARMVGAVERYHNPLHSSGTTASQKPPSSASDTSSGPSNSAGGNAPSGAPGQTAKSE